VGYSDKEKVSSTLLIKQSLIPETQNKHQDIEPRILDIILQMTMSEFDKLAGEFNHVILERQSLTKTENYSRCYGKNQLRFGSKPVLVVIDCVKAYHDPTSPLYAPERFDEALKSILRLIEKCRAVGIPVVYTSVIYETPQSGGKWYTEKLPNVLCCYDAGNPFRDFAEGVMPRKDEVVVLKQYSSSFFGTALSSLLASWGCDCTILCGYSTSGCVRATGKQLLPLNNVAWH
jgi:maleamate amidohydrolase